MPQTLVARDGKQVLMILDDVHSSAEVEAFLPESNDPQDCTGVSLGDFWNPTPYLGHNLPKPKTREPETIAKVQMVSTRTCDDKIEDFYV